MGILLLSLRMIVKDEEASIVTIHDYAKRLLASEMPVNIGNRIIS